MTNRTTTIRLWAAVAALSGAWIVAAPTTRGTASLMKQLTSGTVAAQREASAELAKSGTAAVETEINR